MTPQDVPEAADPQELTELRQQLLEKIVHREVKRQRTSQLPWLLAALQASHAAHATSQAIVTATKVRNR